MLLDSQWKKVLNRVENEVTAVNFDLWISNLQPVQLKPIHHSHIAQVEDCLSTNQN